MIRLKDILKEIELDAKYKVGDKVKLKGDKKADRVWTVSGIKPGPSYVIKDPSGLTTDSLEGNLIKV
jgi:hypothetical protein